MRTSGSNQWASLRLATVSAWLAMAYGDMPGANKKFAKRLTCYTRSQLGYILGDTGRSYVVGVGKNYPTRVRTSFSLYDYLWNVFFSRFFFMVFVNGSDKHCIKSQGSNLFMGAVGCN